MADLQTNRFRKSFARLSAVVFLILPGAGLVPLPADQEERYPIPENLDNVLFYIRRSLDSNVVVYQLRTDQYGNPDSLQPIKASWIKYTEGGKREDLTAIQEQFSYGIRIMSYNSGKQSFVFHFAGYDKRVFILSRSVLDQRYHVYTFINNQYGEVNDIFINIAGGSFWVPVITHVDLNGKNPKDERVLSEVIKP